MNFNNPPPSSEVSADPYVAAPFLGLWARRRTFCPQDALCLLQVSAKRRFPLRSLRVPGEMSPRHAVICNRVHPVVTDTGDVFSPPPGTIQVPSAAPQNVPWAETPPAPPEPTPPSDSAIVLLRNVASSNFLSLSALCQAARRADGVASLRFCGAQSGASSGLSCKLMSPTVAKRNR